MMMRALIFLCFFGTSLVAAIFNCTHCYTPLEGTNNTASNATASPPIVLEQQPTANWDGTWISLESSKGFPPKTDDQNDLKEAKATDNKLASSAKDRIKARRRRMVPEQQPTANWDGTWISVESSKGFPPKPDDQNDLKEAKAIDNKLASSAKDRSKTRRRRVASNWNPLGWELSFKEDKNQVAKQTNHHSGNENQKMKNHQAGVAEQTNPPSENENQKMKNHQPDLNATAVAPLDGSNSTSNSSTDNLLFEEKMKDHQAADRIKVRRRRVASNWNPLGSDKSFKDDGNQLNATAVAPLDGSNSTSNSSTVAEQTNPPSGNENQKMKDHQADVRSTASPEPNHQKKQKNPPPSFWHPLKNIPGFPPEESEEQTKQN